MRRILNQAKLKATKPRLMVLSLLSSSPFPISANEIYESVKGEGIDLSTVYRTLNAFVEAKLVKKEINAEKENVFSLENEDDNHVLVCAKCHKRIPLPGCPYHEANEKIEEQTGFLVLDHNTEIYGVCPDCQK